MERVWVSWNIRGLGQSTKRCAIKQALGKVRPEVTLLQETKINENNKKVLEDWARGMELETSPAEGASGGLLIMWKRKSLSVIRVCRNSRFLILLVKLLNNNDICLIANVYGPNEDSERGEFFANLGIQLGQHDGAAIVGGDFNATLNDDERRGDGNHNVADQIFKHFVEQYELIDLPLRNGDFTWNNTRN